MPGEIVVHARYPYRRRRSDVPGQVTDRPAPSSLAILRPYRSERRPLNMVDGPANRAEASGG